MNGRTAPFPRPCTEQDLDANQKRVYPWMEQQGRGPVAGEQEPMSFAWNPMTWRQEIWQVVCLIVILATFGSAFYGVGLYYRWY